MKVYRQPNGSRIKKVEDGNDIKIAALEKLGWEEITAEDIEGEDSLSVTYENVTPARAPQEPPAVPKLNKTVPPGPTRDNAGARAAGTTVTASGIVTEPDANNNVTEEVRTPDKVGDPVLVVTEQPDSNKNRR
jgi:hypothetical protein